MIRYIYIIGFVFVIHISTAIAQPNGDEQLNITFFIDSIENILETAPNEEQVYLLDTIIKVTREKYPALSLLFMEKLTGIQDGYVGSTKKTAIYKEMSKLYKQLGKNYKSHYYFHLYTKYLDKIPEKYNTEFYSTATTKSKDIDYKFINKHTLIVIILIFILLLVIYLSLITTRIKDKKQKLEVLKNELKILGEKNKELKEELEKLALKSDKDEQKKIERIRSKVLELKKELTTYENNLFKRNSFLANISPEIKTSLSSMIGFSEALIEELSVTKNEKLLNYAIQIHKSIIKLSVIFQNMVDTANININVLNVNTEVVDLKELLDEIIYKKLLLKINKNITIKISNNETEVISNKLHLSNTILGIILFIYDKEKTTELEIRTESNSKNNSISLIIEAKNTNIIAESLQNALSDDEKIIFSRENRFSDLYFNIYASQNIFRHLKNKLSIEGDDNKILFKMEMPAHFKENKNNKQRTEKYKNKEVETTNKKLEIFLVEDDRMNRLVIETMLKHIGKVTSAVDGEETLKIFKQFKKEGKRFDVLLFDINLPAPWDGIMLMKKIREDYPEYRDVPCIAQTAYAMASDKEKFLNEGFDDYLTKPINKNELITIIYHQIELFSDKTSK